METDPMERLVGGAQYQQHSFGKVWHRFDPKAFDELVANIASRGLDQEILLYEGMILEGWHRYLACLATKTEPRFVEFKGTSLEAAEKVHATGVRRQSTPDQRYAAFTFLCDACPEFREKHAQLKVQGQQQKEAGAPLSTDGQRVDVLGTKAKAAAVSRSTAAKVEKVKKFNPDAVAEIAAGKTTANKELKKIAESNPQVIKMRAVAGSQARPNPKADPHSEETQSVVLKVTSGMVAQTKELLEDFGIKPKITKTDDDFMFFVFPATANDQNNVLTAIGDQLLAKGPIRLQVTLDGRKK